MGQRVQLRPPALSLDDLGAPIVSADDSWLIDAVTDNEVRISNPRTGHFTNLGNDHIHHYTTNPDETRRTGIPHGFLTLVIQVFLQGPRLTITPSARPGEPVVPERVALEQLEVDINFPSDSGLQANLEAAGFKLRWSRESLVARRTTLEGWSVVLDRQLTGRPVTYRVRDRHEDLILLMKVADEA